MTRAEFIKITMILRSNYQKYPNYVKSLENPDVIDVQYALLKDLEYRALNIAVTSWCMKEKFPPTVAELRSEIYDNSIPGITDDEAWGLFMRAVRDYNYSNADTLYKRLGEKDEALEQVARNMNIHEVATSPINNLMADRAHFLKLYAVVKDRVKSKGVLSDRVRKAIGDNMIRSIDGESNVKLLKVENQ
jgi:hypothetical protein